MTGLRRLMLLVPVAVLLLLLVVASTLWLLGRLDGRYRVGDWRVVFHALTGVGGPVLAADAMPPGYVLPEGLSMSIYASDLPRARMLQFSSAGDLLVSQPRLGRITLLRRDANGDGRPDARAVLLAGLERPHGLDIADGWLYVGEDKAVGKVRFDVASGQLTGDYRRILTGVPDGGNHWTRTVRVGPDGWLYLSIGSSCNVCIEKHPWRAAMVRLRTDGSGAELFANGLRNSVGFDWAPWSGELYATDNGRDLLGDDFPPCELNRVVAGGFYGWPHLNGNNVRDPDFGDADPALLARALPPAHGFAAHNAPLGMRFLRAPANVKRWGRAALVALHGSWNRSTPDGYKVVLLQWDAEGRIRESDFISGFLLGGEVRGRPVDIAEAPDGTIYVSDDYAGVVYRLGSAKVGSGGTAPDTTASARADPLAGIGTDERRRARQQAQALMRRLHCVACHAPGTPTAEKLTSLSARYTVAELSDYFLAPTPPMPQFTLDAAERRALAIALLDGGSAPMLDSAKK